MFESLAKRNLSQSARGRQTLVYSVLLVLTRGRDMCCSANAVLAGNSKFPLPLLFSTLVWVDLFQIYGKALWFLKLVFQAADGEDLVILACTVFD